jgi:hypothetical protein
MKAKELPVGMGKEEDKSEMVVLCKKKKSFEQLFMEIRAIDSIRKGNYSSVLSLFLLFILSLFVL